MEIKVRNCRQCPFYNIDPDDRGYCSFLPQEPDVMYDATLLPDCPLRVGNIVISKEK